MDRMRFFWNFSPFLSPRAQLAGAIFISHPLLDLCFLRLNPGQFAGSGHDFRSGREQDALAAFRELANLRFTAPCAAFSAAADQPSGNNGIARQEPDMPAFSARVADLPFLIFSEHAPFIFSPYLLSFQKRPRAARLLKAIRKMPFCPEYDQAIDIIGLFLPEAERRLFDQGLGRLISFKSYLININETDRQIAHRTDGTDGTDQPVREDRPCQGHEGTDWTEGTDRTEGTDGTDGQDQASATDQQLGNGGTDGQDQASATDQQPGNEEYDWSGPDFPPMVEEGGHGSEAMTGSGSAGTDEAGTDFPDEPEEYDWSGPDFPPMVEEGPPSWFLAEERELERIQPVMPEWLPGDGSLLDMAEPEERGRGRIFSGDARFLMMWQGERHYITDTDLEVLKSQFPDKDVEEALRRISSHLYGTRGMDMALPGEAGLWKYIRHSLLRAETRQNGAERHAREKKKQERPQGPARADRNEWSAFFRSYGKEAGNHD